MSTGTIYDGEPPTNFSSASACTGSSLVCDPIELDVTDEIVFVSGGPLVSNGVTVLTTPPSSSGNSAPTTWTITAGEAIEPIPVFVAAYVEYEDSLGTAFGSGWGSLLNGVLTYEMDYALDLSIFEVSVMNLRGILFDGVPPTGITTISSCEGSPLVCDGLELGAYRTESFDSGGPFSETDITVLTTPTSASGRTPPSLLYTVPVDEDFDGDGFLNEADNCPLHSNPDQSDADGDGKGDVCMSLPPGC